MLTDCRYRFRLISRRSASLLALSPAEAVACAGPSPSFRSSVRCDPGLLPNARHALETFSFQALVLAQQCCAASLSRSC